MTIAETMKTLAVLQEFYPRSIQNPEARAKAWHLILGEFAFSDVQNAVKEFVQNDAQGFPPSPGQIASLIPRKSLPVLTDEQRRQVDLIEEGKRRRAKYHAHGLRSPGEALEAGVKFSAWVEECIERMDKLEQV